MKTIIVFYFYQAKVDSISKTLTSSEKLFINVHKLFISVEMCDFSAKNIGFYT